MVRIDYTKPIKDSDIVDWRSDRGWIYITFLGVASNDTKMSKNFYDEDIKQIVIDDFDESIQIAILLDKPIRGYDVINYKNLSYTTLFIHTGNKVDYSSSDHEFKSQSIFDQTDDSTFPKYNTNFKNAFNKARDELGPNSIFKFYNKLYTTNHPGEETSPNPALIERENYEEEKELYVNQDTGDFTFEDTYVEGTYSFFKDKVIPKKKSENQQKMESKKSNPNNFSTDRLLGSKKTRVKWNQEDNKNTNSSLGDSIFVESGQRNNDFDLGVSNDWLNDRFPKNKSKYSGYHPNWSFPDETENLDYYESHKKEKYSAPKSFPKRITDPGFSYFFYGGIKIDANIDGIPIYIDSKYVGDTPLNKPIQVEPGWHQVSGFSAIYNHLSLKNSLQFVSADPIVNNNELYGAETVYVESGKVETVQFKFNDMGDTPKRMNEINGGMFIGLPIISLICGIIIWGIG
tara:strand:- start:1620 stop:2996 length:1377 start_codon:yes stop_codon:yes gene_type:complete